VNSSRFVQANERKTMNRAVQHLVNQNAQTTATRFRLSWLVLTLALLFVPSFVPQLFAQPSIFGH